MRSGKDRIDLQLPEENPDEHHQRRGGIGPDAEVPREHSNERPEHPDERENNGYEDRS